MSRTGGDTATTWAELVRGSNSSRAGFWVAVFFVATGAIGLAIIVSAGAFDNHGAGFFWLVWLAGGIVLFAYNWRTAAAVTCARTYAAVRGFDTLVYARADHYPGMLFAQDRVRVLLGVRTRARRFVEIGNLQPVVNPGNRRPTGYIRMVLARHVPHIVLLARRNGPLIPFDLKGSQQLSLEGDFDSHFTLYAPAGYETDALYIFSPDVMDRFISHAQGFTCELVDDELYLYSRKPLDIGRGATLESLEPVLRPLAEKLGHQLELYADDRVTDPAAHPIAPEGRRLIGPVATTAGVVLFAVVMLLLRIYLLRR